MGRSYPENGKKAGIWRFPLEKCAETAKFPLEKCKGVF